MVSTNQVNKNCKYATSVDSNDIVICRNGGNCCCQWQLENTVFYTCDVAEDFLLQDSDSEKYLSKVYKTKRLKIVS